MEGSEGNMSLKNPVTTPGIDPGTVRLVAQHLNHYATTGTEAPYSLTLYGDDENNNKNKVNNETLTSSTLSNVKKHRNTETGERKTT